MHKLKNLSDPNVFNITVENGCVERVKNWKVLGVIFDENLSWNVHINEVVRSSFAKSSVLRKLKKYADHNRRKQLVEVLVFSKIDYALPVLSNVNKMEINRFHKVLKSAASFVTYRFCHTTDVINIKWLPVAERINYYQLKLAHKAIYEKTFPNYLKITFKNTNERLRKIKNYKFKLLTCKDNAFHGSVSSIFNKLENIRSEMNFCSKLIK